VNYISITVAAIVIIAAIVLTIYFKKKYKDLDGFGGFLPAEKESRDEENGSK